MTEETGGQTADSGPVVWSDDQIKDVLRTVVDPELHINIVDLGLVYEARQNGPVIEIKMTLTSPGCPYGPYLLHQVKDTASSMKGIEDCVIEVVWEPMWGPAMMSEEAKLELGFDL